MFMKKQTDRPASRARWAAIGAAVAVCLGAGGIGIVDATTSSGERAIYKPIDPCRMADTRPGAINIGDRATPLGADETYTLDAWGAIGDCTAADLPNGITALALNVTAVNATTPTFLTLIPAGGALPVASHLNPTPGVPAPLPNAVNVDLNAAGEFSIYNKAGTVDIIIDVVGVYDDHNHDDRYYTKTETDAQEAGTLKTDVGQMAYAWVCSTATTFASVGSTTDVAASCDWDYNPGGDAINVLKEAVGTYNVTFDGYTTRRGHVQVSTYASNANCTIQNWTTDVNVRCYNPAGALVDSAFTILWME